MNFSDVQAKRCPLEATRCLGSYRLPLTVATLTSTAVRRRAILEQLVASLICTKQKVSRIFKPSKNTNGV